MATMPEPVTGVIEGHIKRAQSRMHAVIERLIARALDHDRSRMEEPELSGFLAMEAAIRGEMAYGSPEYKEAIAASRMASELHYSNNAHHPEHYREGVSGMSLLDILIWLADCKAGSETVSNGGMLDSLEYLRNRYAIGNQLYSILQSTIKELEW